uniref:Uncharacterized protein n=1 Tax=Arundo donax TaxID=35708 RepID=A0A0A9ATM9_ARUDO
MSSFSMRLLLNLHAKCSLTYSYFFLLLSCLAPFLLLSCFIALQLVVWSSHPYCIFVLVFMSSKNAYYRLISL